ncbi:hypothetical protein [Comamonas sp.]|jgi:hypothetical protein|uniref:hypothetical protein n=1 Tax=Comamonas sp. TaxID=34028 RepID=UPI00258D2475|nr:hypothetical protein [Comamonas sp.]
MQDFRAGLARKKLTIATASMSMPIMNGSKRTVQPSAKTAYFALNLRFRLQGVHSPAKRAEMPLHRPGKRRIVVSSDECAFNRPFPHSTLVCGHSFANLKAQEVDS